MDGGLPDAVWCVRHLTAVGRSVVELFWAAHRSAARTCTAVAYGALRILQLRQRVQNRSLLPPAGLFALSSRRMPVHGFRVRAARRRGKAKQIPHAAVLWVMDGGLLDAVWCVRHLTAVGRSVVELFGRLIARPRGHARPSRMVLCVSCNSGSAFRSVRDCPRRACSRYLLGACLFTALASEPPGAGVKQSSSLPSPCGSSLGHGRWFA